MSHKNIAELRLLGYIGAQLSGLLTPLLVFHLTHSTTLAGIALIIEWLPKLLLYFTGGSLAQTFGFGRSHLTLEIIRLMAFGLFMISALGHGSVWLVALAAACYQCCNAVWNVLFEMMITNHWPAERRAQGYAMLMKKCQQGCLVGLLLGLSVDNMTMLCLLAMMVQTYNTWRVARSLHILYPTAHLATQSTQFNLMARVKRDISAVGKISLLKFSLSTMLLGVPIALLFSSLAFFLDRASPGLMEGARVLSLVLIAKTALSIIALEMVQRRVNTVHGEHRLAWEGSLLLLAGIVMATLPLSLTPTVIAVMLVGTSMYLYLPWVRSRRQELLCRDVLPDSRAGAMGILISVEASSYILGASMLSLFGSNLSLALAVSGLMAAFGILMQRRVLRANYAQMARS